MRALISVSDKTGIIEFAQGLVQLGWEIISTGGTYKKLRDAGIEAAEVSDVTQFPEMFDGRVKTLNPYIHGGILYRRDVASHVETARVHNIVGIDLVCVNLYPFKETISSTEDFETIIENIDIGGPTLIRAAAKNFQDVLILTDVNDYDETLYALQSNSVDEAMRRDFMIKAFEHTGSYDAMIANYMNERFNKGFGQTQFIVGTKAFDTKYGENPHQKGALYEFDYFFSNNFKTLKGEASFNNMTDIHGAVKIAAAFGRVPAVSIIKHANPCGFAMRETLLESYIEALKCDPVSAFGGVVAINGTLDAELANKINETFIEVIIAANVTPDALAVFEDKKRIKIFTQESPYLVLSEDAYSFKHVDGGFVYQESDSIGENEVKNSTCRSKRKADKDEMRDLEIAYKIASLTKSNCVVYVKDSAMVAIGMGMTSRVDAAKCALLKAKDVGLDVQGCSMASEAFFPFRDSIDAASEAGVKSIIQPGGSIRDKEIAEAANEHGMALYFTGVRHFLH